MTEIILNEPFEGYKRSGHHGSSALYDFGTLSRGDWKQKHIVAPYASDASKSKPITSGSALDTLVTDPTEFDAKWEKKPPAFSADAWAEELENIKAAGPMALEAIKILADGSTPLYQVTLRGEIEGVKVQDRPDVWIDINGEVEIPDLKYTSKIEAEEDGITAWERGFVGSREWFQTGLRFILSKQVIGKDPTLWNILVETGTTFPRALSVKIPLMILESAERDTIARCRQIKEAIDDPIGFTDSVKFREMRLPPWAMHKIGLPY